MMEKRMSLEELTRRGEEFYLKELREDLERDHMGHYAVIDVENKRYEIDPDEYDAIKKAQRAFGEKLFYIVRIGDFWETRKESPNNRYAWRF
jgi:hypothetical protein